MSDLLVHGAAPRADGTILEVTPESAGWRYVGLEVLALGPGAIARRETGDRELCVVVVAGTVTDAGPAFLSCASNRPLSKSNKHPAMATRITKL